MPEEKSLKFKASSVKIPPFVPPLRQHPHPPLFADIHLSNSSKSFNDSKHSLTEFISSITKFPPKFSNPFHSITKPPNPFDSIKLPKKLPNPFHLLKPPLISEILVRNQYGEVLERKDLEEEAVSALKTCRPNSALTLREVQEDVNRIIGTGYFSSCLPVREDTRDGIRLVFQVEPNQDFQGVVCEGATLLPTKYLQDAFSHEYGKTVKIRGLQQAINSINGWYMERGIPGSVTGIELLSGGKIKLQVLESVVNDISVRFLSQTGEPTTGKTRRETITRQLNTEKGQVYNRLQAKQDVDTLLGMGILKDVSIVPQFAGDSGKVDLTVNAVERVSSPVKGISICSGTNSGITGGPLARLLAGVIGSCTLQYNNLFGRNKKINLTLDRGLVNLAFKVNYIDPWIEGDDKRTSRTIMFEKSTSSVHGNQPDSSNLTVGKTTAGIEYSRPFRPNWRGTAGLFFQHAGVRDEKGNPMISDLHSSPVTASGNIHDKMVLAKLGSVYTDSSNHTFSKLVVNMEQGLPVGSDWLVYNKVTGRAKKDILIGRACLNLSVCGGHVVGKFPPHEAFMIGGSETVRGYEEGAIGTGRSYAVGSGEISFPLVRHVEGAIFADYGTDFGSGTSLPGDPTRARLKARSGYGVGAAVRVGIVGLEYALNDQGTCKFHFRIGPRN